MRVTSLVVFRLAAFLAAAGLVYVVTSHEPAGGSMMLIAAATFVYLGVVLRAAVREGGTAVREDDAGAEEEGSAETIHVGPTIWPFVFSLAAAVLVLGIVVERWLLVAGSVVFVASAIGWFVDVRRQHRQAHR